MEKVFSGPVIRSSQRLLWQQQCYISSLEELDTNGKLFDRYILAGEYESMGHILLKRCPLLASGYYRLALRVYKEIHSSGNDDCLNDIVQLNKLVDYAGFLSIASDWKRR